MRIPGPGGSNPGSIRLIDKFKTSNYVLLTVIILCLSLTSNAWGQKSLISDSLSTPILFDSSVYVGEPPPPYDQRTPVADPPGGLASTAAWAQYGMKLDWNVIDNGNGTYTYYYHFWPGWAPDTNGSGGGGGSGTGNPYVTNKEVIAFDIQLKSLITMADIGNPTWNVYQSDGKKIGSGTVNSWINYDPATEAIISKSSDYNPIDYPDYNYTVLTVGNLKGKTGNFTAGYLTQNLFYGLKWFMPADPDTGSNLWKADVNFDLTFTSTYSPGWGDFFANSGQTGSNNNYSEVVAFDGTFDATGKSIATWLTGASIAGGPDNVRPWATISAPSLSATKSGPVAYTVTYNDDNFLSLLNITLSPGDIILNHTGTAGGTVSSVGGTGNSRTVTINKITGDGTLGISLPEGTATDKGPNAALAAGPSTTFTVDNTPPSVTIGLPSAAITRNGPVTFTITYNDANFDTSTLSTNNITLNKTGNANGSVSVSGLGSTRTVTISGITGDGTLGISIAAGTAGDTAGNAAPASNPSLTFKVDNTAPTVSTSPSNGTQNVAVNSYVTANFSEDIDPASITGANFTVSGINGTVSYNQATHIATFTPNTALAYSTTYNATLTGVKDLAGNTMSNQSWAFTTEPIPVHPVASITYSPSGPYKSGTIVTISAAFSEPMAATPVPKIALSGAGSLIATDMTIIDNQHYTYDYIVPCRGKCDINSYQWGDLHHR
jgi:hypothetical protein